MIDPLCKVVTRRHGKSENLPNGKNKNIIVTISQIFTEQYLII